MQPASIPLCDVEKILGMPLVTAKERYERLSERERQVAGMMADGKPNQQIAEELGISPKTLDIHRGNLMRKLEARTSARVANIVNLVRVCAA
jgi:DNA-binding CsgD family transcriptional regulator